ncbi:MAG: hopanoid-associated sugar epimerase [Pseudomonadota bacterium]
MKDVYLVTGASGFVGAAIVRALRAEGASVRVLARPTSDTRHLRGAGVEIVRGDLLDPDSLAAAVAGCRGVFHAAADYRLWAREPAALYRTNVQGTVNLLRAAARAGVERAVHTSSVATVGLRGDGTPADEDTPSRLDDMIGHYKRSKFVAEQEALKVARDFGLALVVVNPAAPVGPGDRRPTPTGRMVLDTAAGRTPAYVDTGLSVVHVDDVARGHLLAYRRGTPGERYILGGENLALRDILARIARLAGARPPRLRLPLQALMPLAWAAETWAAAAGGGEPRLTRDGLRLARKRMYFASAKAQQALGYAFRPAEDGLRDAIAWFRENGYLT